MKPTFRNLFINIEIIQVPEGLAHAIAQQILVIERKTAKRRCIMQSILSIASLVGGITVFNMVADSFSRSGFYDYFQLIFSGDTKIFSYWQELGLSLVESLPLFASIVLLSVAAVFIWSAINAARNARVLLVATTV